MRLWQIFKLGSIFAVGMALAACQPLTQVNNRGYVQTMPMEGKLVPGTTSQQQVRDMFGSPSTVSSFPPETWYYISRQQETVAFLEPELTEQQVVRIEFDDTGKVAKVENFERDAVKEIDYVNRETPTEGRSIGLLEQLLGNLGRFNSPRDLSAAADRR